jgi:hypothetical protein
MVARKQVCLTPAVQKKVEQLAARWGCTEADVIRHAMERLAPANAGLVDDDAVLPETPEALDALEREYEDWVDSLPEPLGLSQAVIEDRR